MITNKKLKKTMENFNVIQFHSKITVTYSAYIFIDKSNTSFKASKNCKYVEIVGVGVSISNLSTLVPWPVLIVFVLLIGLLGAEPQIKVNLNMDIKDILVLVFFILLCFFPVASKKKVILWLRHKICFEE